MTPTPARPFSRFLAIGALCAALPALAGEAPEARHDAPGATECAPEPGPRVIRVGGEPEAEVTSFEASGRTIYTAGRARIGEALPRGYPRPTAPGAIEIKSYPSVRRAEISGAGDAEFRAMGRKSSQAFWPLFQHIKQRGIAMTAPVEMDYPGMTASGEPDAWSMSFLYRTPELGDAGADGRIEVYDTAPITVVSIGVRGRLDEPQLRDALDTLERWLGADDQWRAAGSPRTFGYNGPMTPSPDRWWEVQLPIERTADATASTESSGETPTDAGAE